MGYYLNGSELNGSELNGAATTTAISVGANLLVPGSGPIVAVGSSVLENLFGGAGEDAARQARVDWFTQAARQGSVIAARMIIAGPANVGGNEKPMWQKAIQAIAGTPALAEASQLGPAWDSSDDRWSSRTRAAVESELEQKGQSGTVASSGSSSAYQAPTTVGVTPGIVHAIQGMTTTAPYNYTPLLLLGGGLLVAAFVVPTLSRRRRR